MFNEGQKLEYLDSVKYVNAQLPRWLSNVWGRSEQLEKEKNKDIAEWTASEIIAYYKSLLLTSLDSLNYRQSQLKRYADWCLEHQLIADNQNHYKEISIEVIRGCLNEGGQQSGIVTRSELEKLIADLPNSRDQCLVYALFEGIEGKQFSELVELNIEQYDIKTQQLRMAHRLITISDKMAELMRESTEEYTYYAFGKTQKEMHFPKEDTNVFKMTPNSTQTTLVRKRQRLYTNLQRIKNFIGNQAINTTSLMESGRIDMIKSLMKKEPGLNLQCHLVKDNRVQNGLRYPKRALS